MELGPDRWAEPLYLVTGSAAVPDATAPLALHGGPLRFALRLIGGGPPATHPAANPPAAWRPTLHPLTAPLPSLAGLPMIAGRPRVMGILNVTPDSFSGDGADSPAAAIARGHALRGAGADILDVGGESTRPGATPVPPAVEIARILPVVRALAPHGPVSIDTRNAATMDAALFAGARIVNDVSALRHDPDGARVVARHGAAVVLMHMLGDDPRRMQDAPAYADVALEVAAFLRDRIAAAVAAGIPRDRIAVDPGIGFGKLASHNLALLARLPLLAGLGCPILVGTSRKGFIGRISGEPDASRRAGGSVATALFAASRGAAILRVHDVAETVQALRVWAACHAADAGPDAVW